MRNLFYIAAIALLLIVMGFGIFRKRMKARSRAILIIGSFALAIAAFACWTSPRWEYPETTGPYEPAFVRCTYTDESRVELYESDGSHRWLNLDIWYPKDFTGEKNTCPVVVFSHGSFGVKESNVSLCRELASNGYLVCAIDHTYQCLSTTDAGGRKIKMDKGYRRQILRASDSSEESRTELYGLFREWMDIRMGDIHFVLDTILARAAAGDTGDGGVYLLADASRIGVIGHSLGGAAALGMGRARDDVRAVIALEAPFMYDVEGVTADGFSFNREPYPAAVLNVYTDSSWNLLGDSPQYAQNNAMRSDQSDTTEDYYVKGAGHMTLTDLALSKPPLCLTFGQDLFFHADACIRTVIQQYLDFLNRCLKGQ